MKLLLVIFLAFPVWAQNRYIDGVNVVFDTGEDFKIGPRWSDNAKVNLIGGKVTAL